MDAEVDESLGVFYEVLCKEDMEEGYNTWTDAPTRLLIELCNNMMPCVGKSKTLKTKKKMWIAICTEMRGKGYNFTYGQIENRWKTLIRCFKRKTEYNQRTGRQRAVCAYEKELAECLAKNSDEDLECSLASEDQTQDKGQILISVNQGENSEVASALDSTINVEGNPVQAPAIKRQKKKKVFGMVSEIRKLRESKERYHKLKLEAYERRTAAIEERNRILSDYLPIKR